MNNMDIDFDPEIFRHKIIEVATFDGYIFSIKFIGDNSLYVVCNHSPNFGYRAIKCRKINLDASNAISVKNDICEEGRLDGVVLDIIKCYPQGVVPISIRAPLFERENRKIMVPEIESCIRRLKWKGLVKKEKGKVFALG